MLFRNKDRLRKLAVRKTYKVPARSIGRIKQPMNRRKLDVPFVRQFGPERLREVRHQLEVIKPALIDGFIDLRRAERRMEHLGQLGPFVIEEKIHESGISLWLLLL